MRKIACLLLASFSLLFLFSCHKEQNEIEISRIIEIQENAIDVLNSLSVPGQSGESIINNCIQQLLLYPEVASAYVQDFDQIVIKYKSGITSVILLIDETEEQEKRTSQSIKFNTKGINDEVQITNYNVLIWDWWSGNHFAEDLQNIFDGCSDINFNVVVKQYYECNLQSLFDLTNYGSIYIHSHGGFYENSHGEKVCWLLTREIADNSQIADEDVTNERKILVTTAGVSKEYVNDLEVMKLSNEGHYWAVSNKFISKYVSGTFTSPSVVYIGACHTFDNSSLRDVFINEKNASYYLGFTHAVTQGFVKNKAIEFATNMLQQKLNAEDAYDAINVKVDDIAWPALFYWYWNAVFSDHINYVPPRAMLIGSRKENPTYFVGYVECPALSKRWKLTDAHYFPAPYQNTTHFSQLQFGGPDFQIVYRLSKMNSLAEGTYDPYVINDIGADTLWETNFYPMRFLAGTYSGVNGSSFWHEPETHYYSIRGGKLKYQKQNNLNKFTFDIIGDDGHSYRGEFIGEIHQ